MSMARRYPLLALLVLALGLPVIPAYADDYPYSIMQPEPGSRHVTKHRPPRAAVPRAKVKHALKHISRRGSSSPVYPQPLPAPQNLTGPSPQQVVTPGPPAVPPLLYVPQTGRVLQNLPAVAPSGPNGTETFQDRAARCAHQAGVYGQAAGDRTSYIGSCINQ
jgi:hypothetical protein